MTTGAPEVSVVIPAYDPNPRFLTEALASLVAQTETRWEAVVVDDGSKSPFDETLRPFADQPVRLMKQANGGPARARNAGIRATQAPFVAFLDADDVWEPTKLAQQLRVMAERPAVGLVYGPVLKIDETGDVVGRSRFPGVSGQAFHRLFWRNVIPTSSVLVRRACLQEVGSFDEDPALFAVEDYDLWLRVAARYEIHALETPEVRYRTHASGISRNVGRSYSGEKRVLELARQRFCSQHPAIEAEWTDRLAQVYLDWAEELIHLGRTSEARGPLLACVKLKPAHRKAWMYLMASALGANTLARLKQLRARLR